LGPAGHETSQDCVSMQFIHTFIDLLVKRECLHTHTRSTKNVHEKGWGAKIITKL